MNFYIKNIKINKFPILLCANICVITECNLKYVKICHIPINNNLQNVFSNVYMGNSTNTLSRVVCRSANHQRVRNKGCVCVCVCPNIHVRNIMRLNSYCCTENTRIKIITIRLHKVCPV